LKRAVLLLVSSAALLFLVSCSGSGNSVTGPNGNATVNAPSKLQHRAFITNQFSGNLQIVDSQNDTTAYYTVTNNNTGNSTVGGQPASAVSITVGGSLTWEILSPDDLETLVYNPQGNTLTFITNSSEATNGSVSLAGSAPMGVYSADSKFVYVPEPAALTNSRPGAVQVITTATGTVTANIIVPSAQGVAISPDGNTLLVFAANSDTMYVVSSPSGTSPTPIAIPGFSRPVSAFFSSDGTTAYVLNCGPECGSSAGPPSVMKFDVASKTITATVPVGGATVGLLKGTILYVAGYPGGSTGTFDIVDVSAMTRSTPNPIVIGDGTHTTMAISNNNKLYIGAVTCANVTAGCLSIIDVGKTATDPQPTPLGAVTGMQAISGRNVMYVVQGGVLNIYDTTTGQLQSTQIAFRGAVYGVLQIDQ
jgi:hypothetical protein